MTHTPGTSGTPEHTVDTIIANYDKVIAAFNVELKSEIERLNSVNAELLEACKKADELFQHPAESWEVWARIVSHRLPELRQKVWAAIEKAEGQKSCQWTELFQAEKAEG